MFSGLQKLASDKTEGLYAKDTLSFDVLSS